jgi:hypothetical protein
MHSPVSEKADSGVSILGLTDHEEKLVQEIMVYLEAVNCEDIGIARTRFSCLRELGMVISRFPSIRESQMVRGETRNEEKLIESIHGFFHPSHLLRTPTRVVAVRGFLVAKSHAFTMLNILVRDKPEYAVPVRRIIFSIICTLMIEEVYFSCLDDASFPDHFRFRLVDELVTLWDSGVDPWAFDHLPALEKLWVARDAAPPSFGTMDGASELMRVSSDLGDDWYNFLTETISNEETMQALEEFLFGLSHEEILEVRSRLIRFGISAVGNDEVRSYLGSNPAYTIINSGDPRSVYDFYVNRRDAARLRKRMDASGPKRTLEEIYLKHRIVLDLAHAR